jgi:hypothetical protein
MLRIQGFRLFQGLTPNLHRLAGNRKHQIDIDIFKAAVPCKAITIQKFLSGMNPSQTAEKSVVQGLSADA